MKPASPVQTACMLCDELIAVDHGVVIRATGTNTSALCCSECYAMFCDFRIALQLMPPPAAFKARIRGVDTTPTK